jgi:hypothetical protein
MNNSISLYSFLWMSLSRTSYYNVLLFLYCLTFSYILIYFSNIFTNMRKILHAPGIANFSIILESPLAVFVLSNSCVIYLFIYYYYYYYYYCCCCCCCCTFVGTYRNVWDRIKPFSYDMSQNSFMEIIFRMKLNSTSVSFSRYALLLVHLQTLALQCFSTRLSKV